MKMHQRVVLRRLLSIRTSFGNGHQCAAHIVFEECEKVRAGCRGGPRSAYLLGKGMRRGSARNDRADRVQARGGARHLVPRGAGRVSSRRIDGENAQFLARTADGRARIVGERRAAMRKLAVSS